MEKVETRKNVLKYCEQMNFNPQDKYYMLRTFHVETREDLDEMLNYIRSINHPVPIPKEKDFDGPTKIYVPKLKRRKK